jgi:hypothetical protein
MHNKNEIDQEHPPINVPAALNAPETRWVVPLLATHNVTQKRHAEGTAFFIAPNILLTAWHNISALIAEIGNNPDVALDSYSFPAWSDIKFMTLSVLQNIEGGCLEREVKYYNRSKFSNDIAVLYLRHNKSVPKETLTEYVHLDADPPLIGERVRAFGYTDSIAHDAPDASGILNGILLLGHDPRLVSGNVAEVNEKGLGSLRPFPYVTVSADFVKGMSGGPVINRHGRICGVVSMGLGGTPPISYAASIWPILGELIQWEGFNDGHPFTIMELVRFNVPGRNHPYVTMANFDKYTVVMSKETGFPERVIRKLESSAE